MLNQLSDEQFQRVVDYIKQMFTQKTKVYKKKLNNEQKELLDLLNYTSIVKGGILQKNMIIIYTK